MTGSMDNPPHVFIVRVWQDSRDAILEWRGSVEYVPTQERVFFRHTKKVTDFMLQKTGSHIPHYDNRLSAWFKRLATFDFGRQKR